MIRALTLFSLITVAASAMAQCTSAITSNAQIVDDASPFQIASSAQSFWACSDAFQTIFSGNQNNIWIESGAFVSVTGSNNTVYYKGIVPLGVFGSNNTIYAQSASAISDQGTNNTITACGVGAVVFTYASAPNPGCAIVGLEEQAEVAVQIQPNPIEDVIVVSAGTARVREVSIVDLGGRTIAVHTGEHLERIPVAGLASGTYLVRITTDRGTLLRRVNKL